MKARPFNPLHPEPVRYTEAVLLADYDTPPTTWQCGHHVAAGACVVVEWAPDRERARVYQRVTWGTRPLFSCPLENIGDYVRSTKGGVG